MPFNDLPSEASKTYIISKNDFNFMVIVDNEMTQFVVVGILSWDAPFRQVATILRRNANTSRKAEWILETHLQVREYF